MIGPEGPNVKAGFPGLISRVQLTRVRLILITIKKKRQINNPQCCGL